MGKRGPNRWHTPKGACNGCNRRELLPGERFVTLNAQQWHRECLEREQAWSKGERDGRALVPLGKPASYTAAELAELTPDIRREARSQHWDDVLPSTGNNGGGNRVGTLQRPQELNNTPVVSLHAERPDGSTLLDQLANTPAPQDPDPLSRQDQALLPVAKCVQGDLFGALTERQRNVWSARFVDRLSLRNTAKRVGVSTWTVNADSRVIETGLSTALDGHGQHAREAIQHAGGTPERRYFLAATH